MPCSPPFYPSPGHSNRDCHDRSAQCFYYAVWRGWVRGGFTNSWIARNQTEGFSDSQQKSFKTWDELLDWWTARCMQEHGQQCPAFELLNFSLTAPAYAPPAGPGCTRVPAAAASTSTSTSTSTPPACCADSCYPRHHARLRAPRLRCPKIFTAVEPWGNGVVARGYGGLTAASFQWAARHTEAQHASTSTAPAAAPTAAPSPFNTTRIAKTEPISPSPHKEEPPHLSVPPRVTPSTRVQLTPVGRAHADTLARRDLSPMPTHRNVSPSRSPASTMLGTLASARTLATPSILSTPAGPLATAPPPSPEPGVRIRMYGVHGVGVFYDSYTSAWAAATRLGLEDSKIMVTDNVEKLEAWITGKPFVGEEW
ncbi:hypothetical protein B0H11DRAFT_2264316 [Mycena galericulata]|nr:hypothetical protein B0H11DRAFT_2264316 [Mycena galericulata]